MLRIYSFLVSLTALVLPITGLFSKKMHLFVQGRKGLIKQIQAKRDLKDKLIWIHAASLGEYEQALPVIHKIKQEYPEYKIWLSFFSPSGYEIKKNTEEVDYVSYLPLDTAKNAKVFIQALKPQLAIFIKYEVWPNLLNELEKQNIPKVLVSALFRKDQNFFKNPNGFRTKALLLFDKIGVQNQESLSLLKQIGYTNAVLSGDTRFDRVIEQTKRDNALSFLDSFCKNADLCIVCGSTWPEDEAILTAFIQKAAKGIKFVIAPHEIHAERIEKFRKSIDKKSSLWSEDKESNLEDSHLFFLDTIGYLGRAYAYADIAYVGGAVGTTGLHNILEPATFGIPVLYGKNTYKHPEAEELEQAGGGLFISTTEEANKLLEKLTNQDSFRKEKGDNAKGFIQNQAGATEKSMQLLRSYL